MKSNVFFMTMVVFLFSFKLFSQGVPQQEAMITSFQGVTEVFIPDHRVKEAQSYVIFEGKKFGAIKPKIGLKLKEGDMVRTGNDGKCKFIFTSGDVFILGSSSAFTVPVKKETDKAYHSELLYGKVRALVDKKGPLSQIEIKTQTAVSGVRGTDLVVLFNPLKKLTEVHVIRGEVQVQNKPTETQPLPQEVRVQSGHKVEVLTTPLQKKDIQASNQLDLKMIKVETTVQEDKSKTESLPPEIEKTKKELEKKSVENVIRDIQQSGGTPTKELELLVASGGASDPIALEDLSSRVIESLAKKAPEGPKKPKRSDFLMDDQDVYKKFFKSH